MRYTLCDSSYASVIPNRYVHKYLYIDVDVVVVTLQWARIVHSFLVTMLMMGTLSGALYGRFFWLLICNFEHCHLDDKHRFFSVPLRISLHSFGCSVWSVFLLHWNGIVGRVCGAAGIRFICFSLYILSLRNWRISCENVSLPTLLSNSVA